MTVINQMNVPVFRVDPLDGISTEEVWQVTLEQSRHWKAERVQRSMNEFRVDLVEEDTTVPLPSGEGASGDNDAFIDVWNDVF